MSDFEINPFPEPPDQPDFLQPDSDEFQYDIGDLFEKWGERNIWMFITGYHSINNRQKLYYAEYRGV
jgi:hypothetical protein